MKKFGINIISTFGRKCSITYVACNLVKSLLNRGVPISLANVVTDNSPQSVNENLKKYMVAGVKDLNHPINLYVLPAMLIEPLLVTNPTLCSENKIHVF